MGVLRQRLCQLLSEGGVRTCIMRGGMGPDPRPLPGPDRCGKPLRDCPLCAMLSPLTPSRELQCCLPRRSLWPA